MENQEQKNRITRKGMSLVFLGILSGWILDLMSSSMGFLLGLSEASPYFLVFPMGWMLMMSALAVIVYFFRSAPFMLRGGICLWIVFFSFLPSIRNMLLIWSVVI